MTFDKIKASAELTLFMTDNGQKTGWPSKMFKDQTVNTSNVI